MKEKIMILLMISALVMLLATPFSIASDTAVTGTFTATGDLDVDVNDSSPAFGSIAVSNYNSVLLKLTNNGTVTADVTQDQAVYDSGAMTIGTNGSLDVDEYSVMMIPDGGGWTDIGQNDDTVIVEDLAKDGTKDYTLRVYIGPSLTAESHADEQFSADVTVAAAS